MMVIIVSLLLGACGKMGNETHDQSSVMTSKVDGVSDEVYKQLLEFYFYLTTFTDMLIDNIDRDEKSDMDWHTDHELYEEAIEYVEAQDEDIYLLNVFPNPLLYEYHQAPENFTENEAKYIDMIAKYMEASNRMNIEDYTKLKAELKVELQIDEQDNMFP